jgi:hypothetical protein
MVAGNLWRETRVEGQNMNRVLRAWGANSPDWVKALAAACDKSSQGTVAHELEISSAVVNQLLGRSYKGRVDRMESRVRGQYMKAVVDCPVLGEISTRDCQENQARARGPFRATNPLRIALRKSCPTCPNRDKECSSASKR